MTVSQFHAFVRIALPVLLSIALVSWTVGRFQPVPRTLDGIVATHGRIVFEPGTYIMDDTEFVVVVHDDGWTAQVRPPRWYERVWFVVTRR